MSEEAPRFPTGSCKLPVLLVCLWLGITLITEWFLLEVWTSCKAHTVCQGSDAQTFCIFLWLSSHFCRGGQHLSLTSLRAAGQTEEVGYGALEKPWASSKKAQRLAVAIEFQLRMRISATRILYNFIQYRRATIETAAASKGTWVRRVTHPWKTSIYTLSSSKDGWWEMLALRALLCGSCSSSASQNCCWSLCMDLMHTQGKYWHGLGHSKW